MFAVCSVVPPMVVDAHPMRLLLLHEELYVLVGDQCVCRSERQQAGGVGQNLRNTEELQQNCNIVPACSQPAASSHPYDLICCTGRAGGREARGAATHAEPAAAKPDKAGAGTGQCRPPSSRQFLEQTARFLP